MRPKSLIWLFVVALFGVGCKSYGTRKLPALGLTFNDESVAYQDNNNPVFTVPAPSTPGDKVKVRVEFTNLGSADLKITSITLTGNKDFTWDSQYLVSDTQPLIILPGEKRTNSWLYYQESGIKDEAHQGPAHLTIVSNDPEQPQFTVELLPPGNAPHIKVSDTAWTFASATVANPEVHNFVITDIGKSTLIVKTVYLQNADASTSQGFQVIDKPYDNSPVKPMGGNIQPRPDQQAVVKVQYTPQGPTDQNVLIIESNDPDNPKLSIPLYGKGKPGKLSISYEDQLKGFIDFQNVIKPGDSCVKRVVVTNEGPGMVTLRTPKAQGDDQAMVNKAYKVRWYTGGGSQAKECGPYTKAAGGAEITSTQYPLSPDFTVDIVVTYTAQGAKGVDADLVIPYSNPYDGKFTLHMAGGSAKPQIEIAPTLAMHSWSFMVNKGGSEDRTLVIYNKGLGPLTIESLTLTNTNQVKPPAFTLKTAVNPGTTIPAFGYLPIVVHYDTNYDLTFVSGELQIVYDDPYTGKPVTEPLTLPLEGNSDLQGHKLPVADPGKASDYGEIHAGDTVLLDGITSKGGDFAIIDAGYAWFLTKKPQNSKVFLNVQGKPQVSFTPDVAGNYEIRLIVTTQDPKTSKYYYSPEAVLDLNVLSAAQ